MNKQVVIFFSVDAFQKSTLDDLTKKGLCIYYKRKSRKHILDIGYYPSVEAFLNDLNDDHVDTENNYFYLVDAEMFIDICL